MAERDVGAFDRGEVYFPSESIDATANQAMLGREMTYMDGDLCSIGGQARNYGTGTPITVRMVRNAATVNLLPGQRVSWKDGRCLEVDGYTDVTGEAGAYVDEFLPAAGVAPGQIFWVVVDGITYANKPTSGASANLARGDFLQSVTAAASTVGTTAGKVEKIDFTALTDPTGLLGINRARDCAGMVWTAATTGESRVYVRANGYRFR